MRGRALLLAAAIAGESLAALALPEAARATGTPAGTAITNMATVNYTDGNNNSYTANSNTVTTTVQEVATNTVTSGTGYTVPGGQYDSVYTVTNTGNGNGNFAFTFGSVSGNDASSATPAGYQVAFSANTTIGTLSTGCSTTATLTIECDTTAHLSASLANIVVPPNGTAIVTVPTNVATSATAGTTATAQTIVSPLASTVAYTQANNAGTSSSTTTSASASASFTEAVETDARIDLSKTAVQPNTGNNSTANIAYTIYAANGGTAPARDSAAVKSLLGSSAAGILITDAVPAYGGAPLAVQTVSASATGSLVASGATTKIYYTSSSTGASGWTAYSSGALPAGTTFVGVLVSGGANGVEINGNGNATSGGGTANAPTSSTQQVTISLQVTPPSGSGSGNANAVVNQADSVADGNYPNTVPVSGVTNAAANVVGPNIAAGTADSTTAIDSGSQGILYPTQSAGSASTQGGASNAVGAMATLAAAVFDGPYQTPEASGSYNGTTAASTNADFTAISYTPSGFTPTNTSATGVAGNATTAASTVTFSNTLQNVGNAADSLAVSITAPSGWGVQIYAQGATANTTTGSALAGSTTSNTASYTFANVPSGSATSTSNQQSYAVVYTVPAGATAFAPYDVVNTVTSGNSSSQTNTTHNDVIVGGPVAVWKTQTLDTNTCTGGVAVPGCIVTYALNYVNNAEASSACPSTAPTAVPAFAGGYYAKNVTLSESGTTAPSTWGTTYTNAAGGTSKVTGGLNAAATDTTSGTTFTTNAAGSYAFTAAIGGSGYYLAPGCSGKTTFAVTISTQ